MPKNVVSVTKHYIRTVLLMSNLYFDLLGQSCEEFCLRHGKTGNKKRATCFATIAAKRVKWRCGAFYHPSSNLLFVARQVLFG